MVSGCIIASLWVSRVFYPIISFSVHTDATGIRETERFRIPVRMRSSGLNEMRRFAFLISSIINEMISLCEHIIQENLRAENDHHVGNVTILHYPFKDLLMRYIDDERIN